MIFSSSIIVQNNQIYTTIKDRQGSIRKVIDINRNTIQSIDYDAYGNILSETGSNLITNRFYTGREYDRETGLYYLRARYYDAQNHRFLQRDPLGNVDSLNQYLYVTNNPLKYTDPTGMEKYIIFVGNPHDSNNKEEVEGFENTARYQYESLLKQGIKPENILAYHVDKIQDINNAIRKNHGNIRKIIYIAHGWVDYAGEISKTNINQLTTLPLGTHQKGSAQLISCETGKGTDNIAQAISNKWNTMVVAPNMTITIDGIQDKSYGEKFKNIWFNTPIWTSYRRTIL